MKSKLHLVGILVFALLMVGRSFAQDEIDASITTNTCDKQLSGDDVIVYIESPVQIAEETTTFEVKVSGDESLNGKYFSVLFKVDGIQISDRLGEVISANYSFDNFGVNVFDYTDEVVISYQINDFANLAGQNIQVQIVSLNFNVICTKNTYLGSGGEADFDAEYIADNVFCVTSSIGANVRESMIRNQSYDAPDFCEPKAARVLCEGGTDTCTILDTTYCCEKDVVLASNSDKGCNTGSEDYDSCMSCMYKSTGEQDEFYNDIYEPTGAIWTSLGCIDPSPSGLITRLYQIGIGIVGGLILLIKVPQIVIAYNSGDPEKIKDAQSGVWSIAGGLLLLVFATIVLETLGVHVIGLPSGFI